jgi:hypothetical protein
VTIPDPDLATKHLLSRREVVSISPEPLLPEVVWCAPCGDLFNAIFYLFMVAEHVTKTQRKMITLVRPSSQFPRVPHYTFHTELI